MATISNNHPRRSRKIAAAASAVSVHDHDVDYAALLDAVRSTFSRHAGVPLFMTDVDGLMATYLDRLGDERQIHVCSACRKFIETFGALVVIESDGRTVSAFWDPAMVPEFYRAAVGAMKIAVEDARVLGVFLSSEKTWGIPKTGPWMHFSVPSPAVHQNRLKTAGQAMASKREDYINVARSLADFAPETITEAIRVLKSGHLAQASKFIAPLRWMVDLHAKQQATKHSRRRKNLLWNAIATAPDGYCHPRSAVTGSLLEDLHAGLTFADVKARWEAKVHPLLYQRPQAAPAAGNIAEAEKIVEKLGIARSLERRFARLDECQTIWRAASATKGDASAASGVFAHLTAKGASSPKSMDLPATTITWEKFSRTVLPTAEAIEVLIVGSPMGFIALTTATHEDAPPILKWDDADARNPVAWYVYSGRSVPSQWGLEPGWTPVPAIVPLPTMWGEKPKPYLGEGFVLIVSGCADRQKGQGNALFPECLVNDLHAVRSTIEAYSRRAEMTGREDASACGLDIRKGSSGRFGYRLRVTGRGGRAEYIIDRWD